MSSGINIDQLANEITSAVQEYTEDVSEAIKEKVNDTSKKTLKTVKEMAPKRTGEYAKGFKRTKNDNHGRTKHTIWNKKDYRRVHLLEKGHAKRNGGRVKDYPHLVPAYDKHAKNLPDEIKKIIKNGGDK